MRFPACDLTGQPVTSANVVIRKLPFGKLELAVAYQLAQTLIVPGMVSMLFAAKGLELRYDAALVDIDAVIEHLQPFGLDQITQKSFQRRIASYRFVDTNLRAHLDHRPVCCNRSPQNSIN